MADTTGATTSQGEGGAQPQGGSPEAQGATTTSASSAEPTTQGTTTVEALTRKVAELERDNRAYRQQLRAAQEAEKAKGDADKTESERLTARVADLERQVVERERLAQEQSLRLASITAAQKLGYRNPDLAYRLLDVAAVEYDQRGQPRNVDSLLTALAKSDPYLLAQTDFGGGTRGTPVASQGNDMNTLIRAAARR